MTLEVIARGELRRRFISEDGEVNQRAVADSLRAPIARWGLSPERLVLRHARDQLRVARVEFDGVRSVLNRLTRMGECERVTVCGEVYIAPAAPRWMRIGEAEGVYLTAAALPPGVPLAAGGGARDIARRIDLSAEEALAQLDTASVREVELSELLSPLHYLRHASRRLGRPARSDQVTLGVFWDLLRGELERNGAPLGDEAELRVLAGVPGAFFGSHKKQELEGRWAADAPDGVWCAYRRGYGDAHWHPVILEVRGGARRVHDLFDEDEWRWAVLARGRSVGSDEQLIVQADSLRLRFNAPSQLSAALDLIGAPTRPWTWRIQRGAPDLWAHLR